MKILKIGACNALAMWRQPSSWRRIVLRSLLLSAASSMALSASATEAYLSGIYLQSIGVVQANAVGHQAGNFEIQIAGGFTVPAGMSCDPNYITTLRSVDADKRLFSLLSMAVLAQKPVTLHITDNPAVTAFNGRCSLFGATLGR
jgi:hypothetical protein